MAEKGRSIAKGTRLFIAAAAAAPRGWVFGERKYGRAEFPYTCSKMVCAPPPFDYSSRCGVGVYQTVGPSTQGKSGNLATPPSSKRRVIFLQNRGGGDDDDDDGDPREISGT